MEKNYDIAIIGGGPAGATLARLLSPRFSVVLLDKKSKHPDSFSKCCGGLLNPDAQKAMSLFGLGFPKELLVNPQIFSVRTIDLSAGLERYYQRFYLNFNRHQFDLWLLSLLPAHVTLLEDSRCTALDETDAGYRVTFRHQGQEDTLTCRYLVGADGAHSLVRSRFSPVPIRQYTCIQQSYPTNQVLPYYTCFFDKRVTDCYGWINVKDNEIQLGAALPKENARERFEVLRRNFCAEGYDFTQPLSTEACLINRPSSLRQITLGKGNAFLLGEAAGFVSPSSLEGISYAMESAHLLAKALASEHPRLSYHRLMRPLKGKIFLKLLKSPFMYWPFLRGLVMKSGITALPTQPLSHTKEEPL